MKRSGVTVQNRPIFITSPTGQGIRVDPEGDGHFGAPRGYRVHTGLDFLGEVGQDIVMPFDKAYVSRIVRPYVDTSEYMGLELVNNMFIGHLLYLVPNDNVVGSYLTMGEVLGTMQDITARYSDRMRPHVHLDIFINPEILGGSNE